MATLHRGPHPALPQEPPPGSPSPRTGETGTRRTGPVRWPSAWAVRSHRSHLEALAEGPTRPGGTQVLPRWARAAGTGTGATKALLTSVSLPGPPTQGIRRVPEAQTPKDRAKSAFCTEATAWKETDKRAGAGAGGPGGRAPRRSRESTGFTEKVGSGASGLPAQPEPKTGRGKTAAQVHLGVPGRGRSWSGGHLGGCLSGL